MFIGIAQRGAQNAAPKKASTGTAVVAIDACAATNAAIWAARSRVVPSSDGAKPKSATAQRVQRGRDGQRFADAAPIVLAVLVFDRVAAAVARW